MRKKSLAAVPPVYAAARNRQRRVRLCGVCLGLGVAVTACGADGHGFGGQDASEIQSVQETQESQDAGNVQDEQEAAGTQKEEEIRKQVLAEMTLMNSVGLNENISSTINAAVRIPATARQRIFFSSAAEFLKSEKKLFIIVTSLKLC